MRYSEITDDADLTHRGQSSGTMIRHRFAIPARDLERAVRWFKQEPVTDVALPVVQGWILAVQFSSPQDANRFAHGAFGRSRWRAPNRTVVYLANRKAVDVEPRMEIEFARRHLDQLGLQDRGEIINGLTIDCDFVSPELASAFAQALNAADIKAFGRAVLLY